MLGKAYIHKWWLVLVLITRLLNTPTEPIPTLSVVLVVGGNRKVVITCVGRRMTEREWC
jgi:hypothetical protein